MTVTINLRTLVAFATGLAVALIAVFVFQAWQVDAAPGDSDTTFVPITPCRIADTRPGDDHVGTKDAFGADESKSFQARGSHGKCTGIPNDAVGLSLNVTAVGASQPTFLTFWPSGNMPTASSLNPAPGQPPIPNAVTTSLSGAGFFNVYNRFGNVDVIIDINGYYTKASLQDLNSRVAALEASQPFTVASERINFVSVPTAATEIRSVTVEAPVDGQVAVAASGDMYENNTELIECGLMDTISVPTFGAEV
jgi:hypothetical protein